MIARSASSNLLALFQILSTSGYWRRHEQRHLGLDGYWCYPCFRSYNPVGLVDSYIVAASTAPPNKAGRCDQLTGHIPILSGEFEINIEDHYRRMSLDNFWAYAVDDILSLLCCQAPGGRWGSRPRTSASVPGYNCPSR